MKYLYAHNEGFSLVEVLVAVTILLLVMAGPMRVLTSSTNSTTYSSEQVVAYFLAQEGLELVQLGRDNLVLRDFKDIINSQTLEQPPWAQFQSVFSNCISGTCGLTATNADPTYAVTNCATLTNCRLYLNTSTPTNRARYTHTAAGNTETPYTRTIKIGMITAANGRIQGAVATSTVTWRTGSLIAGQKVELVTYLTNVYDTP
jgi:prepilin-type N-terminal cleavage/methylation domain-containing protein